jgi:4-hydroxy-tetrahydrodipicolinate reductase
LHTHGREGRPGVRPRNEIGYHALRVGDDPGQHTIVFGMLGETLEVTVKATSRDAYAYGALTAARYLVGKKPGMYSINNVLGL